MKNILLLAVVTLLSACQASHGVKPVQQKVIAGSNYIQIENGLFDRVVVRDKAAFAKYDKIIFSSLKFDKFKVASTRNNEINRSWQLNSADKFAYDGYFKDELLRIYDGEHAAETFGLGSGRGANTLYAEVRLLELNPLAAKYGADTLGTISKKTIESFGTLTIQIMLVDSVTGEFVAVIEDGKDLSVGSGSKSVMNKSMDAFVWKKAFNLWLTRLKDTALQLKNNA